MITTRDRKELESKLLASNGFPDPLEADKDDPVYGLSVAKAIENEWFRRHKNNASRFYDNQYVYHRRRLYARGEQPTGKYKKEMAVDGDLSFLNLDWTPVPVIPKFVDIVVNGISNRLFSVKAEAIDKVSVQRKTKYVQEMEKDMIAKDLLTQAKNSLGIDGFVNDPKEIPETPEELDVYMQLNYKQSIEIAQELAIDHVLQTNEYLEIKKKFDYDVTVLGVGALRFYHNDSDGIKVKYVDPALFVHSHSDDPYRRDCYYYGEVEKLPLGELKKINPNISKEELEQAKAATSDWDVYHTVRDEIRSEFDGHVANVLHFSYKAYRTRIFKKKTTASGKIKVTEKPSDWNPPKSEMEKGRFEVLKKVQEVWYRGAIVLGTNILLKWQLEESMIKSASTGAALPNYVTIAPRYYDGRADSLVERMIPFADQIQLAHLKLQQISARMVPDGVYVDVDGLNEINLGDGRAYNPKRALQLYFQTGSVVGRTQTGLGEFNHGQIPIKELTHAGGGDKLQQLITYYDYNLNKIREVTGLNEARDASMPDERTLVGVQKLAALNSNTATKHIIESGIFATKVVAQGVGMLIADVLKHSDSKEDLIEAIGAANVSILDEVKNLPLHKFAVHIVVEPDAEERQYLEQNIQQALAQGLIYIDDAAAIRDVKNVKLANQLMKILRMKKVREEHSRNLEAIEQQSASQAEQGERLERAKAMAFEAEAAAKIKIENAKAANEERLKQLDADLKSDLMAEEFDYNAALKGFEIRAKDIQTQKEFDRKLQLEDRKATQQSRIAAQQAETGSNAPVNFESTNDNTKPINIGSFEPD